MCIWLILCFFCRRPMIWEFPEADPHWPLHLQPQWQQFMFGHSILVAPVLAAGAATVDVYFPRGSWYELWSGLNYSDASTLGRWQKIEAVPYQIPSYIRGGSILPTLVRQRLHTLFFLRLSFENCQKRIFKKHARAKRDACHNGAKKQLIFQKFNLLEF